MRIDAQITLLTVDPVEEAAMAERSRPSQLEKSFFCPKRPGRTNCFIGFDPKECKNMPLGQIFAAEFPARWVSI